MVLLSFINTYHFQVQMAKNKPDQGILYLVATPIGNLGDISQRALDTLRQVDRIAAEDTRRTRVMLDYFAINKPLVTLHDHNESSYSAVLQEKIMQGENIALVSDAGTPLINDPGYPLVRSLREAGMTVVPIPGPCALITALCASGLPTSRFQFEGFPPRQAKARRTHFATLRDNTCTLVMYESSHRILGCLEDLALCFPPERRLVIARELTKKYETFIATTVGTACAMISADDDQQKGEFVLVIEGAADKDPENMPDLTPEHLNILTILLEECSVKTASRLAARITGMNRELFYRAALELKKSD
jgi:16S rRNA (cytidine1402-2'-O)-methyltransferase